MKAYFTILRPHQWIKNLLVFLPALTAWDPLVQSEWSSIILLFFTLSFLASTTYIINDILDLESDRLHPETSKRPLASGQISIKQALILASVLGCTVIATVPFLPIQVVLLLGSYLVLSVLYSWYLKKKPILDICLLSSFYVLRIIMGLVLLNLEFSIWLLMFAYFFFFSIGLVKRCNELRLLAQQGVTHQKRGYSPSDYSFLQILGIVTGLLSVVIFSNYINSPVVIDRYTTPAWLVGTVLTLFFGIVRLWYLQSKEAIYYDPVKFFIKDKTTYAILGIVLIFIILAHL